MVTATGLDAQVGVKIETTVGTAVTVDKFPEFNSEGMEYDPGYIEPEGLRTGVKFKRGSRVVLSRKGVTGSIEMNHATRLMGTWWKLALGSSVGTPTVSGSGFVQSHQTGDLLGKSATIQVGRPEPVSPYTTRAHTYRGCKVSGWEFSVSDNEVAKFSLDFDGIDEATATALATPSYLTNVEEFNFAQATAFTLGGTVSGTTTLAVASGVAVSSVVKSISFKGTNALATERYGLGSAGEKREQFENGIPTITGTMDVEYNQTEMYVPFKANTPTVLRLLFEGSVIGAGPEKNTLEFIAPMIKFKKVTPKVSGPDIVQASAEFEIYSDGVNNPFQVRIISADSTAI